MMNIAIKRRKPLSAETKTLINTTTIAVCLALAYSLFTHILIPATHSVYPVILYRAGEPATHQNDYAKFHRQDDYLPDGEAWLVKRLGCIAGQYLSRQGNQFYCDGEQIAQVMLRDTNGNTLPVFSYTGVVPEGKAFAVGDTVNSYDSRYWGFISLADTEKLIPLI
ncbi:type IV secretory pathway protease TraF [Salmonella enterica subsp. enterica serovar Enteritidis]|nr:type IV secretory pathway protease TraF [Salmonella enterica subsp. enterica serovar Enteritidis]